MPRRAAYILGSGLVTTLGRGLPAHAAALALGPARPQPSAVTFLERELPFHFATDPGGGAAGFWRMLDAAVADALAEAAVPDAARARMGVFVGNTSLDLPVLEADYRAAFARGEMPLIHEPGYNTLARHVAETFRIDGPRYTFSTACSSSANAVLYARALLADGSIDHALVIGADGYIRLSLLGFAVMMLLSRTRYRPFDQARDGMILGEGAGALVLGREPGPGRERFAIVGGATACDPTNPTGSRPERVAEVMREALDDAGLVATAVSAVKAHGTGTPGNDLAEGLALRQLFGDVVPPLTSIKPSVGHTLGACGAIELAAVVAAWRAGFLPPTPGFSTPDPELGLRPETQARPLGAGAMLCNFTGFGGNNTSLVLERP